MAVAAVAVVTAGAYVLVHSASPDLAAQAFRADLVADHGFVIWDGQWYGGHSTPGYSVVAPALAAVLGLWVAGALAILASAVLFERLVGDRYGTGGRVAALWFAVGVGSSLFSGRLAFAIGVSFGLGALLVARDDHRVAAAGLGALTTLASPVAGAFLVVAAVARGLVSRRVADATTVLGALGAGLALTAAFPEQGTQAFSRAALDLILLAVAIGVVAIPRRHRALRVGLVIYALLALAAFAVNTPLGDNVARLGALFGGPVAACVLWPRPVVLGLLTVPLISWQWTRAVIDVTASAHDESTNRSYYTPLLRALARQPAMPIGRLEIPITHNHWESAYLAPTVPLARGWERQLDRHVNPIFYRGPLSPTTYGAWLDRLSVRWVALPDARLEGASWPESHLIRSGLPYLTPIWHNRHWQLFAVRNPAPMVHGAGRLSAFGTDSFAVEAHRRGDLEVRVRWQPYWKIEAGRGCVYRSGEWTGLRADAPGTMRVVTSFAIGRIGADSPRCHRPTG